MRSERDAVVSAEQHFFTNQLPMFLEVYIWNAIRRFRELHKKRASTSFADEFGTAEAVP